MRNLKKILALALVFAMALTFTAGAAADFTDKADITYVDDVNMLVELGVISGYPDGSFGPTKNITRAEFAKMAYTLKYGSDTDGELFAAQKSVFTDVEGNANVKWAKGYINYCANQKIVSGVGNNKFNPQGNITVAEAAKMILVILGCDPAKEGFTGANWAANVTAKAMELGVFDGWSGDPTALATRELVAKFMKNAIFAPVYTYSSISGLGSQKNALGTADNETLGEQTMDLNTVTGIVVANENYYIGIFDEDDNYTTPVNRATGENTGDSVIYYEAKDTNGNIVPKTIKIDRALADEALGTKVSVFFKADYTSTSAVRDYKNVEVIGDVLYHSDTVVYDVPAMLVGVYPDGNEVGTSKVAPYIGFEDEEGEMIKIYADAKFGGFDKNANMLDTISVPKSDRIKTEPDTPYTATDVIADFGKHAFVSNETTKGTSTTLTQQASATATTAFFAEMGTPVISTYRFVSNDGGETYSYIIKMVNQATNGGAGYVRAYSAAKGSITITNIGTYSTSEVNIIGDIAADDRVVYFRENDILNIVKLEAVTGAVEDINDDGSAIIGGEVYAKSVRSWMSNTYSGTTLANLYQNYSSLLGEETTYYVYNGIVFDIEGTSAEAAVEDYAVILASDFDVKKNTAEVTLAFADNTTGTYTVTDFNIQNSANEYAAENDKASDFANNAFFGMVVKYELTANGVDLSANDLGYVANISKRETADAQFYQNLKYYSNHMAALTGTTKIEDGVLTVQGAEYSALSDSSVIFVIYGNPCYIDNGADSVPDFTAGSGTTTTDVDDYRPVKAVAYKMTEKGKQELYPIANMLSKKSASDTTYVKPLSTVSFALNKATGSNKGVIAAAMTIGDGVTPNQIDNGTAEDTGDYAYVVDSAIKRNMATNKYYLQLTLIDENGLFTAKTVDEVRDMMNNKNSSVFTATPTLGRIKTGDFSSGKFVQYKKNADGVIENVQNYNVNIGIGTINPGTAGFYMVNAAYERGDRLFFIDSDNAYGSATAIENATIESAVYAEKGYDIIAIDDGEYIGEGMTFISPVEESLAQDAGNAVIQLHEGEIIRVFSFINGVKK